MSFLAQATDKLAPKTVSFHSGDGFVVGHLYTPASYDSTSRYPGVIIGGSLTSVKEMMGDTYARELALRGIIAMAIDYRNYGKSSGRLRQYEDPASKSTDLSAALCFLSARPDVAGVGLLGICTSAGNVLYAAASDSNVSAVATVAGFFSEPTLLPTLFGGDDKVAQRRKKGREALELYETTGEITLVPAYSPTNQEAASVNESLYYMDQARGGGVRPWKNTFAVASWEPWLDFDPVSQAPHVKAPTLIVHSEKAAFPQQAQKVHELLSGPKEIRWVEGTHYDFYDDNDTVTKTAGILADHFQEELGQH